MSDNFLCLKNQMPIVKYHSIILTKTLIANGVQLTVHIR